MNTKLDFKPAVEHPELVSPTITTLLQNWPGSTPVADILVAEINPAFAKGEDLSREYNVPISQGANCVIVEAVRSDAKTYVACVAPVGSRIDFNGIVRKTLNSRRVSLAPLEYVLQQTKMEYGSITPIGLPPEWPILIDTSLNDLSDLIIGGGLVKSKVCLPAMALFELPNVTNVEGLAKKM